MKAFHGDAVCKVEVLRRIESLAAERPNGPILMNFEPRLSDFPLMSLWQQSTGSLVAFGKSIGIDPALVALLGALGRSDSGFVLETVGAIPLGVETARLAECWAVWAWDEGEPSLCAHVTDEKLQAIGDKAAALHRRAIHGEAVPSTHWLDVRRELYKMAEPEGISLEALRYRAVAALTWDFAETPATVGELAGFLPECIFADLDARLGWTAESGAALVAYFSAIGEAAQAGAGPQPDFADDHSARAAWERSADGYTWYGHLKAAQAAYIKAHPSEAFELFKKRTQERARPAQQALLRLIAAITIVD